MTSNANTLPLPEIPKKDNCPRQKFRNPIGISGGGRVFSEFLAGAGKNSSLLKTLRIDGTVIYPLIGCSLLGMYWRTCYSVLSLLELPY
jgi:hypothetical protein